LRPEHDVCGVQRFSGSGCPLSTFWQLPAVAAFLLHVWQAGQLGTAQHTPSVQALLAHSLLAKQSWPLGLGPHELLALQTLGAQQSAALLHVAMQAGPPHFDGPHVLLAGVGPLQAPAPSHIFANVCVELPLPSTQVCAAHSVFAGQRRQAPLPSQKPSVPHVEAAVFAQPAEGPTGTGLHVPSAPATAHDWQAPVQAELQQKPWAQIADTHSLPSPHVCPLALSPHRPFVPSQTLGGAQSLPFVAVVQLALHTEAPHL
jgi:hypothetical protein